MPTKKERSFTGQRIGFMEIGEYTEGWEDKPLHKRTYHAICKGPLIYTHYPDGVCNKPRKPLHGYLHRMKKENYPYSCNCQNPALVERRLTKPPPKYGPRPKPFESLTGKKIGCVEIGDYAEGWDKVEPQMRKYHAVCKGEKIYKHKPSEICGKAMITRHSFVVSVMNRKSPPFSCGCQSPILVESRLQTPAKKGQFSLSRN